MSFSDVSSVTSYFSTPNEGFSTTTSGSVASGATVVGLNSVSGLTNGSIFVGVIEPAGTKEQVFTGTVDTGGSQITGVKWTKGSNIDHAVGVSVVDYDTGTGFKMLSTGVRVSLDQDGTLKAGAVDNAAALASNVVTTAKILDSNVTSAKLATDISPEKFYNPYKFRVYRTAALTAGIASSTKVAFDTRSYDTSSNFDITTDNRFVAPVAGFYTFQAHVSVTVATTDNYILFASKNGTEVSRGTEGINGGTGETGYVWGDTLQLAATDYIELFFYNPSGGGKSFTVGANHTYLSGFLVSTT